MVNPYHYADNDPLNKADPLGLRAGDLEIDGRRLIVIDDLQTVGPRIAGDGTSWLSSVWGAISDGATGYEPIDHADAIRSAASVAGTDARLVWGIVSVESDFGSMAPGTTMWDELLHTFDETGMRNTSIGITQLQRGTFVDTVVNHPEALGLSSVSREEAARRWRDLIGDGGLAIRVTSYRLADLNLSLDGMISDFGASVQSAAPVLTDGKDLRVPRSSFLAAGYNGGESAMRSMFKSGKFFNASYVRQVRSAMDSGDSYFCSLGRFTCSGS